MWELAKDSLLITHCAGRLVITKRVGETWMFSSGVYGLLHPVGIFKLAVAPVGIDADVGFLDFLGNPVLDDFLATFVGDDVFEHLEVFRDTGAVRGMALL